MLAEELLTLSIGLETFSCRCADEADKQSPSPWTPAEAKQCALTCKERNMVFAVYLHPGRGVLACW